ncbi:hypothetical protein CBI33_22735 [Rhodococcus erythropolis]|nr:hypothetical protein CBI33_22735 [Rhodococcus erythropolis]
MNVDQTGRLKGWYDECKLCSAKLHLLGMSDAEQKLMDAARYPMAAIEEYYEEGGLGLDPEDLNKLRSAALDAFRREYLDF